MPNYGGTKKPFSKTTRWVLGVAALFGALALLVSSFGGLKSSWCAVFPSTCDETASVDAPPKIHWTNPNSPTSPPGSAISPPHITTAEENVLTLMASLGPFNFYENSAAYPRLTNSVGTWVEKESASYLTEYLPNDHTWFIYNTTVTPHFVPELLGKYRHIIGFDDEEKLRIIMFIHAFDDVDASSFRELFGDTSCEYEWGKANVWFETQFFNTAAPLELQLPMERGRSRAYIKSTDVRDVRIRVMLEQMERFSPGPSRTLTACFVIISVATR